MNRFRDRRDAGEQLAAVLLPLVGERPVVVGLPRGGVVVAEPVAAALGAPLDVVLVRKIGVPHHQELAMGAIGEGGVIVVNDEVVRSTGVSEEAFEAVRRAESAELERRAARYRGGRVPTDLGGRTVVLVDDGLATGSSALAAIRVLRAMDASRVVLAVPVGAPDTVARLRAEADEVVCLSEPRAFMAVGSWYDDFREVTDDDVVQLLA